MKNKNSNEISNIQAFAAIFRSMILAGTQHKCHQCTLLIIYEL